MHVLEFKFCPNCKGTLVKHDEYQECSSCHEKIFINPTPGVSILPVNQGRVLLGIRGIDPFKGELDTLGGFMVPNESAEEAGTRELEEEAGLTVRNLIYLGTYPSEYGSPNGEPVINIVYIAEVESEETKASDDVSKLVWMPINETGKIKSSFSNVTDSLRGLREYYSKN